MSWTYTIDRLANFIGAQPPGDNTPFSRVSTDTRSLEPGDVFFALKGANFDGSDFLDAAFARGAAAAVTPRHTTAGVCIAVDDPLKALQLFAAAHRAQYRIPLIAITGSCGKTTSKELIAAVLGTKYRVAKTKGNLNNEIGLPLSLLEIDGGTGCAVIEMGANHRGEIAALCTLAKPTESTVTLVAPAHLEGFGSIEGVAAAKAEIVEALPASGVFYVNANDPHCRAMADGFGGVKVYYGSPDDSESRERLSAPGSVVLEGFDRTDEGMRLAISPIGELELPVYSRAHVWNVLLAVAVGLRHGVPVFDRPLSEAYARTLRFKPRTIAGLTVIDDTYNANPASVRAALEALASWPGAGKKFAVLGDMLELGADSRRLHAEMGAYAAGLGIGAVIARGAFAGDIIAGAQSGGIDHAEVIDSHAGIAEAVLGMTKPGDAVLVKGSRGMRMERVIEAMSGGAAAPNTH